MAELVTIATAAAFIKNVIDILKGFNETATKSETKEQIHDMLDKLLDLKIFILQLHEENAALKQSQIDLQRKQHERLNYRLHKLPAGTLVYRYEPPEDMSEAVREPDHYLCPQCYEAEKKSHLQVVRGKGLSCLSCSNTFGFPAPATGEDHE